MEFNSKSAIAEDHFQKASYFILQKRKKLDRTNLWRHNNLHVESTSQTKLHSRESVQACHDCYTLEFSLEKTCDVIGSVHPVRKCSKRSKADQSQSRFGTVQVNSKEGTEGLESTLR